MACSPQQQKEATSFAKQMHKALAKACDLGAFPTDAAGQLNVLGHDCDTLGMDSTQVGVFEQTDKVGFRSFLESQDSSGLETEVCRGQEIVMVSHHWCWKRKVPFKSRRLTVLEILGNFTNQTLEGGLSDEKFGTLLVFSDFTKSHGSRSVAVGLLDTPSSGCGLASGLGLQGRKKETLVENQRTTACDNFQLFNGLRTASCLRGAFPPVDLRAVCLVRAMVNRKREEGYQQINLLWKSGRKKYGKEVRDEMFQKCDPNVIQSCRD